MILLMLLPALGVAQTNIGSLLPVTPLTGNEYVPLWQVQPTAPCSNLGQCTYHATLAQIAAFISGGGGGVLVPSLTGVVTTPGNSNVTSWGITPLPIGLLGSGNLPSGVLSSSGQVLLDETNAVPVVNKTISCTNNTLTGLGAECTTFDVTKYGAKCDGVTDDTTTIQAAITAAIAAQAASPNPNTVVVFPPGTCIVNTASLTLSANNVSLRGAGMYQTTLSAPNSSSSNFDMINASGAGYASISDLTIKSFYASNSNYAINNVTGSQMLIQNVQIGGFANGIGESGGNFTANNLFITLPTSGGLGVSYTGSAQVRRLTNSIITGPGSGTLPTACVKITGGAGYDLIGNEFEHCGYSLLVQPASSGTVYSIKSTENWYDTSTSDGVLLDGSASSALVARMSFTNDWFSSSSSGSGLEIKGVSKGVHISNSEFFNNAVDGINIDSSATIAGFDLTGSLIAGNTTAGLTTNGTSGGTVVGNVIGTAADFGVNGTGIILGSGSGSWTITGNNLAGNTTALTNSSGTTTNTIANNNGYTLPAYTVAVTGTGCTVSAASGIGTGGYFTATGGGTCTYTVTFGAGVKSGPNGYSVCTATDQTKGTTLIQSNSSTTTCVFGGATTTSDVIIWGLVQSY
jgi:hypothetical protein